MSKPKSFAHPSPKATARQVANVMSALLSSGAWKATKYLSAGQVVRCTRRWYSRGPNRDKVEVLVHVGRPNYREGEFVRACVRAGEGMPVRKVQLKFRNRKAKTK